MLLGELPALRRGRSVLKLLPSDPRCKMCNAPFRGAGASMMRLIGRGPAKVNPRFCNYCERFAEEHPGGTEIELSLLFADIRDSTALAERSSPTEFRHLMDRFYNVATRVMIDTDAIIDKLVGDEVIGLYLPGFAGASHARQAVLAAQRLLEQTGYGGAEGPWLPVGIGVHTGTAYVGTVGSDETFRDFTALGDTVNITSRLAALARGGEILMSETAYQASGVDLPGRERRTAEIKGRGEPIDIEAWRFAAAR
jgi:adenylate cyclase